MNLRQIFKNDVSSSAFKVIDDETRIVGKWGQISVIDDYFDIWIVSTPPLTERKLNALLKNLLQDWGFTKLNGEAYLQTKDKALVRKTLPLLGIRRKRRLSQETIKKQTEHLARLRGCS